MIGIRTDTEIVRQDLADMVRTFFPLAEVTDGEEEPCLTHRCEKVSGGWLHRVSWSEGGRAFEGELALDMPADADDVVIRRLLRRGAKLAAYRVLQKAAPRALAWGSLTGIRPTKLYRQLMTEAGGRREAAALLAEQFDVAPSRITLLNDILDEQEGIYTWGDTEGIDVYIGIPFCRTRCLYCSFISVDMSKSRCDTEKYVDTLCGEIRWGGALIRALGRHVRAVYIGGGTPSAIGTVLLRRVVSAALEAFPGAREFTVEAGRPDTLAGDMLPMLRDMGISRISINPQTMCDETLAAIGRKHTAAETLKALDDAARLGFEHVNADLIMGLPGETMRQVEETLRLVRDFPIDNLTVHTLTIKRSSALHEHLLRYPLPPDEEVEAMVAAGAAAAAEMGMKPYYLYRLKNQCANLENVGYTKPGNACVYNVDIMEETHETLALGAGAISKHIDYTLPKHIRYPHPKNVTVYEDRIAELEQGMEAFFRKDLRQEETAVSEGGTEC